VACRVVANFLLAWWNECGGFDLTDVWAVDTAIAVDMVQDTNYPHCFGRPPGDG
jgi:hypothetical protein